MTKKGEPTGVYRGTINVKVRKRGATEWCRRRKKQDRGVEL